ncbi:hypothetical protein OS493_027893 [Desmophyllum pertusum]|uniref:Uncharacterized protein n=1 Tax=Desmophyllum pertusum TaxID=174260 RepID=A0A9W9YKG1_9CNID|nr:hypothetical protein OS493_027893 [Desmophyllum pertusum]
MKCPKCENTGLEEHHSFCFKCGFNLQADQETRSPSCDKTTTANAKYFTCSIAQNSDVGDIDNTNISLGVSEFCKMFVAFWEIAGCGNFYNKVQYGSE